MYKSRNNSSIHRDDTISALASIVMNAGKGHTVNLNNPDLAICVEIMKVKHELIYVFFGFLTHWQINKLTAKMSQTVFTLILMSEEGKFLWCCIGRRV